MHNNGPGVAPSGGKVSSNLGDKIEEGLAGLGAAVVGPVGEVEHDDGSLPVGLRGGQTIEHNERMYSWRSANEGTGTAHVIY